MKAPCESTPDALGTIARAGDAVVFLVPRDRDMQFGKVIKCTPKAVRIEPVPYPKPDSYARKGYSEDGLVLRYSSQFIVIDPKKIAENQSIVEILKVF